MELKFEEGHSGVFLIISENGETVTTCHLMIKPEHAKKLCESKYKVVGIQEPVMVLDIPEKFLRWINQELRERQGECGTMWDDALHELGWLKQKQPEPTREELRERIDNAVGYIIRNINVVPDIAFKKLHGILIDGEK